MRGNKRLFSIVMMAFVFAVFSAVSANAQGVLPEILKRMDTNNKSLKSLKASIKMSKHNAQLDEYDLYEGSVQYIPAASKGQIKVRIDWAKRVVEHLGVGSGQYILYRPRLEQAIIGKVSDTKGNSSTAGGALAFMSMNRAQLKANYDVAYIGEETVNGSIGSPALRISDMTANASPSCGR